MAKKDRAEDLFQMPGHLIRRCHQIAVGTFHDACGDFDLTPVQFAVLRGIGLRPGIDQVELSRAVGIDRTTIGDVILRLEKRGLLGRAADAADRRVKRLSLTAAGADLLDRVLPSVRAVQDRLLAPLSPGERAAFIRLLTKVVDRNNENSRAPLES
ncbi:MAG: MarR family transcriptional regulator [Hyphomicrobiales bacterium]|nr:MarR family transcriptional regulator [Hyphomicrobiales bacterium]MCP5370753.1 MarR family transcriptional regulator [Hyphomicrobiales bacterium]